MTTWLPLTPSRRQVAIAGRVLEAVTQRAIAGAVVTIDQAPPQFRRWVELKQLGAGDRPLHGFVQALSAPDGWFHFLNLPQGTYTLRATLPGTGTRYDTATTAPLDVIPTAEGKGSPAIAEIVLPTTALTGTITHNQTLLGMVRVQVEGLTPAVFSQSDGTYLLTGLEVWPLGPPGQPVRPLVHVTAKGYPPLTQGVQLRQGRLTKLDVEIGQGQSDSS